MIRATTVGLRGYLLSSDTRGSFTLIDVVVSSQVSEAYACFDANTVMRLGLNVSVSGRIPRQVRLNSLFFEPKLQSMASAIEGLAAPGRASMQTLDLLERLSGKGTLPNLF